MGNLPTEIAGSRYSAVWLVLCTGQIVSVADRHAGHQVGGDVPAELLEASKEELRKGEDNLNS